MLSDQVQFWNERGHKVTQLTSEECKQHIPILGKIHYIIVLKCIVSDIHC